MDSEKINQKYVALTKNKENDKIYIEKLWKGCFDYKQKYTENR